MRSTAEPSPAQTRRAAALRAASQHNYTAQRVLRALEVIVLCPTSAPAVAAALGVHPRTARRILRTLTSEQYVEARAGRGAAAHQYQPTVRLLAMAAQLAPRLPLVQNGRRAVREIEQQTSLTAYLAIPCYEDVLVIACTGKRALRTWATIPAHADAAGRVLLAHREHWRRGLAQATPDPALDDEQAANIATRGHALIAGARDQAGSIAVAVPTTARPIAALALRGTSDELNASEQPLADLLHRKAAQIAAGQP